MRIGILGTLVWDRLEQPNVAPIQRWGGISYSLAAAAAAIPDGWSVRPIVKVGEDLAEGARRFLASVPGLEAPGAVVVVPQPNNRVHLRYHDQEERFETLTGGVPGWRWDELRPLLDGLDGLYVNFISGFELDLDAARRLRSGLGQPLYADLHSLLLGVAAGGRRVPRRLSEPEAWLAAFDVVQVNEKELRLVMGSDDALGLARQAVRSRGGALLVTRGAAGAAWFAPSGGPRPWDHTNDAFDTGVVPVDEPQSMGDPTGCGDVWGATCFVRLLRGESLTTAMAAANRAARINVNHRGAEGLYGHLRNNT